MGLCWSETIAPPVQSRPPIYIVDKGAVPSAPPYQPPVSYPPQYTYAYPMPQQQQQMYAYYQTPYVAHPPPRQMGTGTAIAAGVVLGAVLEDILDPTE